MATTRAEQYIETIYEIVKKKGYARVKDVSQVLGVGYSTVSEMFKKLDEEGYVNYEKYGGVTLTKKGEEIAIKLSKKHKAIREFLILLGIDEEIADKDACEIEHVITSETIDRITKFVEFMKYKNPLLIKQFRKYYESGELEECPKTIKKDKDTDVPQNE